MPTSVFSLPLCYKQQKYSLQIQKNGLGVSIHENTNLEHDTTTLEVHKNLDGSHPKLQQYLEFTLSYPLDDEKK